MIVRRVALAASLVLASASAARADVPVTAHGDRLIVLPPRRTVRAGSERYQLDAAIPAHPYAQIHESDTHLGFISTAPLVLDDGTVVVGQSSPPAIVWVDPDGHVRTTGRFDERPTGELVAGADGRIFVSSEGRNLYILGPDGTVRATIPPEPSTTMLPGGPIVRADGSVVLVANGGTGASISFLSPSGERVASRGLAMRIGSVSLGPDGCAWMLGSTGVACLDPSGALREAPFGRGANLLFPISAQSIGVMLATELQIRSPSGELRGRASLGAPVQWLVPLPSGGVAVLRSNPTQELLLLGPDASPIARVPVVAGIGVRTLGALADRDGALLTVDSNGTVVALEADGTERWRLDTRRHFARAAVPLRGGGFVAPLADGGLLFVR